MSSPKVDPGHRGVPTVLLRHDLPDGSWHVDWMIAIDPAGERGLLTYRLPRRLDECAAGVALGAAPLGAHRARYLQYEGALSGGRGSVKRLAAGVARWLVRTGPRYELEVGWGSRADAVATRQRVTIDHARGGCEVRVVACDPGSWHNEPDAASDPACGRSPLEMSVIDPVRPGEH